MKKIISKLSSVLFPLSSARRGFTLIEVLIVVSIIGLLSATILVGLAGFRARGRDARRLADLKQIQNGLELYYTKNNSYPDSTAALSDVGINKISDDPAPDRDYNYKKCGNQGYVIQATLDAVSSDKIYTDSAPSCDASIDCSAGSNHFCVSF